MFYLSFSRSYGDAPDPYNISQYFDGYLLLLVQRKLEQDVLEKSRGGLLVVGVVRLRGWAARGPESLDASTGTELPTNV